VLNNLRNTAILSPARTGNQLETQTALAGQRWLENLGPDRQPIVDLLKLMMSYEEFNVYDPRNTILASTTVRRESLKSVGLWLPKNYMFDAYKRGSNQPTTPPDRLTAECDMISFFWTVPWEKERLRRVVGMGNARILGQDFFSLCRGMPAARHFNPYIARDTLGYNCYIQEAVAQRRMLIVSLALRLYYADQNKFPASLDELVPKYLPSVPQDPFMPAGTPLRYRLAKINETLSYSPTRFIELEQPPNPLFTMPELLREIEGVYDPNREKKRRAAIAGLAGASILWQHDDLTDPDELLATLPPGSFPGGTAPGSALSYEEVVRLQFGQPVLWCAGQDRRDDNGLFIPDRYGQGYRGFNTDVIVVVPFPAQAKSEK
jgi:hypothetical protein